MKRIITALAVIFTALLLLSPVSADGKDDSAAITSVSLSDDCSSVTVSVTVSETFAAENESLYLFSLPPGNTGNLDSFVPVSSISAVAGNAEFVIPYDSSDETSLLYSYLIAQADGNGGYLPIGVPKFIENIQLLSSNNQPYPEFSSKKGLQVQLISDAQLIGIKHTVITVSINDLITENVSKAETFMFGGKAYMIDKTALSMLDYRIKTLTNAGIHIYMNLILTFDTSASEALYYPDAVNNTSTAYAINVSDSAGITRTAAYIHYLTSRYTDNTGLYGFCGSYIIGYEVNAQSASNNAGITGRPEYMTACATLLRTADTAARLAYSNARIYTSVSNVWRTDSDSADLIGTREYLSFLAEYCPDIPFGISIDPYPSLLKMTDYWNDEFAVGSDATGIVSMKNINVLTDFLKTDKLLMSDGTPRRVVIGEFGLDGKSGTESENTQAAGYALAYFTAANNDLIEAFIWHRHVDHSGEPGLCYGIYSSSEQLLSPRREKRIREVIAAIDLVPEQRDKVLSALLPQLPVDTVEELTGNTKETGRRITVAEVTSPPKDAVGKKEFLFDFSQSTYSFYPSDNSQYLEPYEENGEKFLRARLINVSSVEFMGIGTSIADMTRISASDYISVKLRTVSHASAVDVRLIIVGKDGSSDVMIECVSTLICNEWTELFFPIGDAVTGLENGKLKLWVRGGSESDTDLFLDVADITLCTSDPAAKAVRIFLTILITVVVVIAAGAAVLILVSITRKKRKRIHRLRTAVQQAQTRSQYTESSGTRKSQEEQPPSDLR